MSTGLYHSELTGLARLAGGLSAWRDSPLLKKAIRSFRSVSAGVLTVLMVGFGAWALLFGYTGRPAES